MAGLSKRVAWRTGLRASRVSLIISALLVLLVAAVSWLRGFAWYLPYILIPLLTSAGRSYLRAAHPDEVGKLTIDDPRLLRLERSRKRLAWTTAAGVVGMFLAGAFAGSGAETKTSLHLILIFALPCGATVLGYLSHVGVGVWIDVLMKRPASMSLAKAFWPGPQRDVADYKPFYSDHWGHVPERLEVTE